MNEKDLLYVKTIADNRSISKAAKELYISQPSLSQALQKIESDLGTPLFVRHSRGMDLTLAGEKYYVTAKEILDIYNDLKTELTYINNLQKGRLNIGIVNNMASFLLPKILPDFHKDYPGIEIYVHEKFTNILMDMVADAQIDFAILHTHPMMIQHNLEQEHLYRDEFFIVCPKGHEIKKYANTENEIYLPDIKDEEFIVLKKGQGIRVVFDAVWEEVGVKPNIILSSRNLKTILNLVLNGMGISIFSRQYIESFTNSDNFELYHIKDSKYAYWDTSLITRPDTYISKICSLFIDIIREYYKTGQPI